jgi:hypothetical protein
MLFCHSSGILRSRMPQLWHSTSSIAIGLVTESLSQPRSSLQNTVRRLRRTCDTNLVDFAGTTEKDDEMLLSWTALVGSAAASSHPNIALLVIDGTATFPSPLACCSPSPTLAHPLRLDLGFSDVSFNGGDFPTPTSTRWPRLVWCSPRPMFSQSAAPLARRS